MSASATAVVSTRYSPLSICSLNMAGSITSLYSETSARLRDYYMGS